VNVEFVSTVAVIAPDPAASCELYVGALGLPLEGHGYRHSERIAGCKSFGIWPLSQAAEACFGTPRWPAERPVRQVGIEFDVGDAVAVGSAAEELEQAGYELLHPARTEPWGQTVARLQSPEGASSASCTSRCSTTRTDGLPQRSLGGTSTLSRKRRGGPRFSSCRCLVWARNSRAAVRVREPGRSG